MTGRFRRSLVRASAALLLLAVIAGLPAALVIFVGWPLPSALPTGDGFAGWINAPVSDATIVNLLAIAAWLLWAAFVQAIGAEARAAWRGMPTRATTRRTVNPMRMAAATLITALTLGTLLTGAAAASPAPAQASTAVTQVVKVPAPAVVRRGPATIHVGTGSYSYVVERGDTLSKISKEWLGDADRWPEICDLNWHRHWLKVGGTLRDCNLIYPGWDLKLPADATPPDAATPVPSASPPAQTQPDPEPEPTDQPTPTPSARTAIPDDPDGVIEPPTTTPPSTGPATGVPAPAATGQPSVASTATATTRPQASHAPEAEPSPSADDTGVSLPDGSFVTWSLGAWVSNASIGALDR